MECIINDKENEWHNQREYVKEELASRFGLKVYDPYDGDENRGSHLQDIQDAKKARNFVKLSEIFHKTVRIDLRLVDRSDIIIAYTPKGVCSVGVPHEIVVANNAKKPVLLVEGTDSLNISLWYYGFIPYECMFGKWEHLFNYLKDVDYGNITNNRWSNLQIDTPTGWE